MNYLLTAVAALGLAGAAAAPARAEPDSSAWSPGLHSRARLIAASAAPDGSRRAGLEIRLDDGFKTYWRSPGSSGVPPTFDFSQSQNLKAVTVRFPAPVGFFDGIGVSNGYKHDVVLPLLVTAADPHKPVLLKLALNYAVCDQLCIPAQAQASVTVSGAQASTPNDALLAAFEAQVPTPRPLGAAGVPAILGIERHGENAFTVKTRLPAAGEASLFAEGAAGWYFETGKAPATGETRSFDLKLVEKPEDKAIADGRVTLTLTSPAGAIETQVPLDGPGQKP